MIPTGLQYEDDKYDEYVERKNGTYAASVDQGIFRAKQAELEAQKKAAAKYQKENIASLACRVKKDQAEAFKAYCESLGKTSNAVLKEFVLSCIGSQSDEE